MGRANVAAVSGDLSAIAAGSRLTGLFGDRFRGYTGSRVAGKPGGTDPAPGGGSGGPNIPSILYTDLPEGRITSGRNNNGDIITLSGFNFGASRTGLARVTLNGVEVADYLLWSDNKISVQLASGTTSGNFEVRNSDGLTSTAGGVYTKPEEGSNDFTVRGTGAIYFVSPTGTGTGTFADPIGPSGVLSRMGPGVTFYFRAGTYSSYMGVVGWSDNNIVIGPTQSGTAGNRIQFVGYPGETVTFTGVGGAFSGAFHFRVSGTTEQDPAIGYITISNISMVVPWTCVSGGAYTSGSLDVYHSGARSVRVVNCRMRATYVEDANTSTGLLSMGHDGWHVLGNEFYGTGVGSPVNNNHIIYVQCGAGNNQIAYNWIHDVRVGHTIQVHTDTPFTYLNVNIHHNLLEAGSTGQSRGMTSSNNLDGTYGNIYCNVFANVGDTVSAITIMSGDWNIFNNTFYGINGPNLAVSASYFGNRATDPHVVFSNNAVYANASAPYITLYNGATSARMSGSNNLFYNNGAAPGYLSSSVTSDPLFVNAAAGDFRPQAGSPLINAGSSSVSSVVTHDRRGIALPLESVFDIGAYEYAA